MRRGDWMGLVTAGLLVASAVGLVVTWWLDVRICRAVTLPAGAR